MNQQDTRKQKCYASFLFERTLLHKYLVVGKGKLIQLLGGIKYRWFNKFIHVPAYLQGLKFLTDNTNIHNQGIEVQEKKIKLIEIEQKLSP